jgi:hypothetical protein
MQKKRNIRLLISLGVLVIAITVLFFILNKDVQQTVDINLFRVADFTQIDKVVITKQGESAELKFDGTRWKVNNELADRRMIDVLFATLQQAVPKRPVAESLQDSISTMLTKEGSLVSLFIGDDLLLRFHVGGNATKTETYFKSNEADQPYVVVIPGYRVYAGGVFELEEGDWKDKYVFSFNWRNFQSLKARYPQNSKNDFEIAMGKTYYEVSGITSVDTTKLNDFLDAVSLLTVDQYVKSEMTSDYDSILKAQPILEMNVSDVSGKTYTLAFYEINDNALVLGVIQGTQLAFLDRRKLGGIVKNRNWFAKN